MKFLFKIVLLFLTAAIIISGCFYYYLARDLPPVGSIDSYRPSLTTKLYTSTDEEFAEFAVERRVLVSLAQIPEQLQQAIIAAEDARFYTHCGLDWHGISRAFWRNLKKRRLAEGGSTITQQLARALFLHPRKTITRKLKEAILALKIERSYSKNDILELYLNQVYFGHGAYGVEAAARTYFDKPVSDLLTLSEAATIAALPQAPNNYSPFRHPGPARIRKRYVLNRMIDQGDISQAEAKAALAQEFTLRSRPIRKTAAPYFAEYIRQYLERKYGSRALYHDGLRVYTTIDLELQQYAREALLAGLRALDKRQGYRRILPSTDIPDRKKQLPLEAGAVLPGEVVMVMPDNVVVNIADREGILPLAKMRWTGAAFPSKILSARDRILVQVVSIEKEEGPGTLQLSLEQEPEVEGAVIAIQPATGHILAMVGGADFAHSKFNRAVQARRQPGSAFKPIVYAAALEDGFTPADHILDAPIIFKDEEKNKDWKPVNYYEKFYGATSLRQALERSRNIVTVKLLEKIGIAKAVDMAQRLGIKDTLAEDLSLALGASGVSLLELTNAYAVFANRGELVPPISVRYITDAYGELLEETLPQPKRVISEEVAYLMSSLLQGVVQNGTGWRAKAIEYPLAGKTGTTNNCIDAWFLGFTPDLATGVWVGFDDCKTLGHQETGSRAACPIWVSFMKQALLNTPISPFIPPPGIVSVCIDAESGLLATPDCPKVIMEVFKEGTEPTTFSNKLKPPPEKFLQADITRNLDYFTSYQSKKTTNTQFSFD